MNTINHIKNDGYKVDDFNDYQIYKDYFMKPPVKKIKEISLKRCDVSKLEKLLVGKYGLVKMRIINKLQFMGEFYDKK